MAVGDRIKRVRTFRGITQKELGLAVGCKESTADVRIAQYETGTRTPKEDMLRKIADVLDVDYYYLQEPTGGSASDIMQTLFELDETHRAYLHEITDETDPDFPEKHVAVNFHYRLLDEFLAEWLQRKKDLADGTISKAEYMEWKMGWPSTADSCGKHEPKKQWRKPPETTG